jgi:hypothetical protein
MVLEQNWVIKNGYWTTPEVGTAQPQLVPIFVQWTFSGRLSHFCQLNKLETDGFGFSFNIMLHVLLETNCLIILQDKYKLTILERQ